MDIKQMLVNEKKYSIKCPYGMQAEFIIVHNTANDASAENEIKYMINNNNKSSFHYAVDDNEVIQGIPENRNSWNAGDGGNGLGNRKGIAIEICYSKSGGEKFDKAEKNAAKFIAIKLKEKSWGIDKIKKHQDFSNKYCPHRTLDLGWERFLGIIEFYMNHPETTKSIIDLAKEVIAGKHGVGEARKQSLGSLYDEVQSKVNEILKYKGLKSTLKSVDIIAKEVIDGKWGNGQYRKDELTRLGYNYNIIQKRVNELLK